MVRMAATLKTCMVYWLVLLFAAVCSAMPDHSREAPVNLVVPSTPGYNFTDGLRIFGGRDASKPSVAVLSSVPVVHSLGGVSNRRNPPPPIVFGPSLPPRPMPRPYYPPRPSPWNWRPHLNFH
ncbi:uncharacterized protein LOC121859033 [Homarus americanus]|uniref:uncharacterized protein LOC121859033 n=1 Tax=Homarus americanus TaxID=6706 RepID=UPI001C46265C|nr:uncharacterized protein LOC121859033 [Homarus americanus]